MPGIETGGLDALNTHNSIHDELPASALIDKRKPMSYNAKETNVFSAGFPC